MKITRRRKQQSVISLPSMADIAFLLLVFFIVTSMLEMEREIPVSIPDSRVSVRETEKYFNLWIDGRGMMYLNGEKTSHGELATYARSRVTGRPDLRALIRADKELPYEYVNAAMEAMKEAGVYNIVLVSKKRP
jgi:biopolymer transport protein ExbD